MNLLIVDIGTSSMRGILYEKSGKKLFVSQIKYQPYYGNGGMVTQDAADWSNALFRIACEVSGWAKEAGVSVDALAVTSQRSSIIPVDKQGNALMDAIMWQDTRNARICEEFKKYNDVLLEKTGALVNTVFSGSKMTWIREYAPDIYKQTYKFLNIPEYVIHLITGEFHSDVTYASRSGLMNLRERRWDEEILKLYHIEEAYLCQLFEPGDVVGKVSPEFAKETGLRSGIPVISSGGDQQCASIAQGAYKEGNLSIVVGTGGFLTVASDKLPERLSKDVICNCSAVRGKYMVEANVLTCCSAFDWFCRNFYGRGENCEVDYGEVNRELELTKDLSPVLALPYFSGRSTPEWNPDATAVFSNVTLTTGKREMLKAVVEGIFLEINNNIDSLRRYVALERGFISGGLTNSAVMNQLQADVYGILLYRKEDCETTALGAFMTAGCGLGLFADMEEAYQCVNGAEQPQIYRPDGQKHELYLKKQNQMNAFYEKIK